MKIKPTGFFLTVEVEAKSKKFEGSMIEMAPDEQKREHGGRDIGVVLEFGPIAFQGFANCKGPEDWGVKVGDTVEFERYDGKIPRSAETNPELKNIRVLTDSDIKCVVEK